MGNTASHAHESLDKGFTRGTFGDVKNTAASFRSPRKMDRLRRSFRDSFRRRKDRVPESSKPHQWQADDQAVRSSTCSFPVKYMGCVEVFESRGMQVCEEALKVLRNSRRRAIRGLLHVSGDGLRVVDDDTKGLIVDQTIEKVSFCAPDRNHERGFSYICRDGTTRRWMCHGFLAAKDSGERLSHAVGCAFAVCLERKQRRDTECGVTMTIDRTNSTFTRIGSFRAQTMTERLQNGGQQAANGQQAHNGAGAHERGVDIGGVAPLGTTGITGPAGQPAAPIQPRPHNPFERSRPHAPPSTVERLERQGSFRTLGNQSPFRRQMSLRLNDLPSNAERQRMFMLAEPQLGTIRSVSPIPEDRPQVVDTVAQLAAEFSLGLQMLSGGGAADDVNFNNAQNVNQNKQFGYQQHGQVPSLIHSPISPPVVSVFPPLRQTLAVSPAQRLPPQTPPTMPVSPTKIAGGGGISPPDAVRGVRAPVLSAQSRSRSLNTSGGSGGSGGSSGGVQSPGGSDPFDAEWVASVARLTTTAEAAEEREREPVAVAVAEQLAPTSRSHHTNPFIAQAQSFQVQL